MQWFQMTNLSGEIRIFKLLGDGNENQYDYEDETFSTYQKGQLESEKMLFFFYLLFKTK